MPAGPSGTDNVIEHEVRIAARPETVFAYFTDPARMVRWMGIEATLDPRPGGVCRIAFHPPRQVAEVMWAAFGGGPRRLPESLERHGLRVAGEFVEVDPPHRIVFTWGFENEMFAMPPQSTLVEVSLTPDGDDTVVRLAHRRLPAGAVGFHQAGWEHYLPRLATVAAGGDPGPDPWHDLETASRQLGKRLRIDAD
jgi:uncharacterized protein YndB with AHSA1/START domain